MRKKLKFTQFHNLLLEKSVFLKIVVKAFEAGDFLTFYLGFWDFEAHFLIKIFLIKKRVLDLKISGLPSSILVKYLTFFQDSES